MALMSGTPAGFRVECEVDGVMTDITALCSRRATVTRATVPGQPGSAQIFPYKMSGGSDLDIRDMARIHIYDDNVAPGAAYVRYFDGRVINPVRTVEDNHNLVLTLNCVGMDYLWKKPPYLLTARRTYGAAPWLPGHQYYEGDRVVRGQSDGHMYEAQNDGTSGETEPTFNTGSGATTTEGTGLQWQEVGSAYVSDQDVLEDLLPVFFDDYVTLGGINKLIADVGYIEFEPGDTPDDCLRKLAERAVSLTFPARANSTAYVRGDIREAAPSNGYYYKCIKDGTSAGSQPTMSTTIGAEIADGTTRWVNMGPVSVAPAWQMAIPEDNGAHTAEWTPDVSWFDTNNRTQVPLLTVGLSDQLNEDGTHKHYATITNNRGGQEYANVAYVFGRNGAFAEVEATAAISFTGTRLAVTYLDDSENGPGTNEECEVIGNKLLGKMARFEDHLVVTAANALDPVVMRGLRFVGVTNSLLGLSSTEYPMARAEVNVPDGGTAEWSYELGAAFRTDREDLSTLGGVLFPGDFTPPAHVTFPADWVVQNEADPVSGQVEMVLKWQSGNEGDLGYFLTRYKLPGNDFWTPGPRVEYPNQVVRLGGIPQGVTFRLKVLAKDTHNNPPFPTDADWEESPEITTGIVPLPADPTDLHIDSGVGSGGYIYTSELQAGVALAWTQNYVLPSYGYQMVSVYPSGDPTNPARQDVWVDGQFSSVIVWGLLVGETYDAEVRVYLGPSYPSNAATLSAFTVPERGLFSAPSLTVEESGHDASGYYAIVEVDHATEEYTYGGFVLAHPNGGSDIIVDIPLGLPNDGPVPPRAALPVRVRIPRLRLNKEYELWASIVRANGQYSETTSPTVPYEVPGEPDPDPVWYPPPTSDEPIGQWLPVSPTVEADLSFDGTATSEGGKRSLKMSVPASTTKEALSPQALVRPGEVLSVGQVVKRGSGTGTAPQASVRAHFYKQDGTDSATGDITIVSAFTPATSFSTLTKVQITVPSDAHSMVFIDKAVGQGGASTYSVWFGMPYLERVKGTADIGPGAVTIPKLDLLTDVTNPVQIKDASGNVQMGILYTAGTDRVVFETDDELGAGIEWRSGVGNLYLSNDFGNAELYTTTGQMRATKGVFNQLETDSGGVPTILGNKASSASAPIIASTQCTNTITETTIYTGSISANTLRGGEMVEAIIQGRYATALTGHTATLRIKLAGTTLYTISIPASNSSSTFVVRFYFTVRSSGASGKVWTAHQSQVNITPSAGSDTTVRTLDTTAASDITLTWTWSAASASDVASVDQGVMRFNG